MSPFQRTQPRHRPCACSRNARRSATVGRRSGTPRPGQAAAHPRRDRLRGGLARVRAPRCASTENPMPASRLITRLVWALGCSIVLWAACGCSNARAVTFADLVGWWRTDLEYNGQRAEMYVRFAEEAGRSVAYVTLPPIHGWDFGIGGVKFEGN